MTTFVLVGGFWIGAWAWRNVAAQLTALGHRAFPLSLTGLGELQHRARADVGLETHIGDVMHFLEAGDLHDVVLVGHSGAGAIVNTVANRMPERLAGLVFVDSGPVPDGACIADFSGPTGRADTVKKAAYTGDGWRIPLPPWEELGEPMLTGLDQDMRFFFRANAADQPLRVATDPVRLTGQVRADLPRLAILCTMPIAAVHGMIASGKPWFAGMDGPAWTLVELPTGHWPMLSEPDKLANLVARWSLAAVATVRIAS
jgi:pimeloyl-ACP methyl ester carboxylesterase